MKYYQLMMGHEHTYIEAPGAERYEHPSFGPFDLYIWQKGTEWRICSAECGRSIAYGSTREVAEAAFKHRISSIGSAKIKEQIKRFILEDGHAPRGEG